MKCERLAAKQEPCDSARGRERSLLAAVLGMWMDLPGVPVGREGLWGKCVSECGRAALSKTFSPLRARSVRSAPVTREKPKPRQWGRQEPLPPGSAKANKLGGPLPAEAGRWGNHTPKDAQAVRNLPTGPPGPQGLPQPCPQHTGRAAAHLLARGGMSSPPCISFQGRGQWEEGSRPGRT